MLIALPADLLQVLESCHTLPSVPVVAMQVLDLCQDSDIGTSKLAKVIARDPALAAKVLRVANSAWCGVRREVTTLDQAVSLLGLNGAMSLALSFSLMRGLQQTGGAFDHQTYWRRSVISAAATLPIGAYIDAANREELFLVGLLQDIGMLVLNQAMPGYGLLVDSARGSHSALVELERGQLNTDHAKIGGWFLKRWGLPDRLIMAVSGSHECEDNPDLLAKSAAIGSRIADIWICPDTAAATAAVAETLKASLNLSSDQISKILEMTAAALPEMTRNLDIPISDETFINNLLDLAREALAGINLKALQQAQDFAFQAQRDTLTSLYNRRYLDQILEERFNQGKVAGRLPFTLIFLDVDKFKNINDTYGHQAGDSVLVSIAQTISSATRGHDIVIRLGGDEFVVFLAETGEDIGIKVAERIRTTVEQRLHDAGAGNQIRVTVSVGLATMSANSGFKSANELLESADRSLYMAKAAGCNRVAQESQSVSSGLAATP
jgi:diguanylate cyclase (GGDEF)-like protein